MFWHFLVVHLPKKEQRNRGSCCLSQVHAGPSPAYLLFIKPEAPVVLPSSYKTNKKRLKMRGEGALYLLYRRVADVSVLLLYIL